MGGKGALNYLPIVPKTSIYVPKVMRKPVMGGTTPCLRLSCTRFSSEVHEVSKTAGPDQSIWSVMTEYMGGKGALNSLNFLYDGFVSDFA